MKPALAFVIIGLFAAPGCGSDSGGTDLPNVDCGAQTAPAFADVAAFKKCTQCHSSKLTGSARAGAKTDVNYDLFDTAKANAEDGAHQVFAGNMPPADSSISLTDAEKQQLYRWSLCGTKP